MGSRTRPLLTTMLLTIVLYIVIELNKKDYTSNKKKIQQQSGFKIGSDNHYCLNLLQNIIDKDEEDNLVIPTKEILSGLPLNVLDCLYHRYSTSLQTYCSKQDKHGSCLKGWNLCVDICYEPLPDTVIRVLSNRFTDNDTRIQSVTRAYQNTAIIYVPILVEDGITFQQKKTKYLQHQNITIVDDVNLSEGNQDILIIDVGEMTNQTIKHILERGVIEHFRQISFRTQYIDSTNSHIDYVSALDHLNQFYKSGFRMYWYNIEWDCILKHNIYRTSCITMNWIHKTCRNKATKKNHQHLIIPDDITLATYNQDQEAVFYQRYLTSIQTHCKEIVRLGGITDGGWDICNDAKYRPRESCLVYSFGINWDFKFDDAIAEAYGCDVHSFDPSMKKNDFQHSIQVSFHNMGLSDNKNLYDVKKGWKLSTLKNIRENLGHSSRKLDILKIDIEEAEWKALPEMIQSGALKDVVQICIEFHAVGTRIHLKILRLLYDEGFRIFWYHRNPNCCFNDKLFEYSNCNEVYFIKE